MPGPVGSVSSPPSFESECTGPILGESIMSSVCVCVGAGGSGGLLFEVGDEGIRLSLSIWGSWGGLPQPRGLPALLLSFHATPLGEIWFSTAPTTIPTLLGAPAHPNPQAVPRRGGGGNWKKSLRELPSGSRSRPAEGGEEKGQLGSRGLGRPPRRVRMSLALGRPCPAPLPSCQPPPTVLPSS